MRVFPFRCDRAVFFNQELTDHLNEFSSWLPGPTTEFTKWNSAIAVGIRVPNSNISSYLSISEKLSQESIKITNKDFRLVKGKEFYYIRIENWKFKGYCNNNIYHLYFRGLGAKSDSEWESIDPQIILGPCGNDKEIRDVQLLWEKFVSKPFETTIQMSTMEIKGYEIFTSTVKKELLDQTEPIRSEEYSQKLHNFTNKIYKDFKSWEKKLLDDFLYPYILSGKYLKNIEDFVSSMKGQKITKESIQDSFSRYLMRMNFETDPRIIHVDDA